MQVKKILTYTGITVVLIFAVIGLAFSAVFALMQFDLLNVRGSIDSRNAFFLSNASSTIPAQPCTDSAFTVCEWNQTPEWGVIKGGLVKDADIIARVSTETGVSERMIAAVVVPEQTRFFTSNREVFKRYFEPLKILGSLSQFSLGVSGIKQDTAEKIELYANDPTSVFYPGAGVATLLKHEATSTSHSEVIYNRLTDDKNHYYSYLYTAVFIKEIEEQWSRAGFDITQNPEAVTTLFNIGFQGSHPNSNPKAAGAGITTGGKVYPYGVLGGLFYRSNELTELFPK